MGVVSRLEGFGFRGFVSLGLWGKGYLTAPQIVSVKIGGVNPKTLYKSIQHITYIQYIIYITEVGSC